MSEIVIISQPEGQRTLALRESYLAICEDDTCEALLLNAHERWYKYKLASRLQARGHNKAAQHGGLIADQDESLWVRMDANGWARELLGIYNEKTVRVKLKKLEERGFIRARSNPKLAWDRTPQYLFLRTAVQQAVNDWAATRPALDIDPASTDGDVNTPLEHSDASSDSTRKNVRMETEEVPSRTGGTSASTRTNVRSNNTGDLNRSPLQESSPEEEERDELLDALLDSSSTGEDRESEERDAAGAARADARTEATEATASGPGTLPATGGSRSPTTTEKVPGPAAAAEARELLERYLGGARRFAQYMAEVPGSGVDRRRWLDRLTAERVLQIVEEARAQKVMKFHTFILQALDVEIGASILLPGRNGTPTPTPPAPERRRILKGDVVVYFGERLQVANDPGDYERANARILLQTLDGQPAYVVLGDDWRKIRHADDVSATG